MKTQENKPAELNAEELKEVNGGGILGGDDSASSNGVAGALGVNNLLSFDQASQDGDEAQASSFSAGNGINLDLGSAFNKITR